MASGATTSTRIRRALGLVTATVAFAAMTTSVTPDRSYGAVPTSAVSPGTFTGLGFDACTAPSSATMSAWLASPYRAVGIYFGGVNRACAQPNLTATWVTEQLTAGWHLIPIYM